MRPPAFFCSSCAFCSCCSEIRFSRTSSSPSRPAIQITSSKRERKYRRWAPCEASNHAHFQIILGLAGGDLDGFGRRGLAVSYTPSQELLGVQNPTGEPTSPPPKKKLIFLGAAQR